jgi:protein SCO1/2
MSATCGQRICGRLVEQLGSWRFAAAMLGLLAAAELLLVALLLLPAGEDPLGAFAEEFRIWCFGLDPATGRLEPGYVVTMLLSPLMLGAVVAVVWGGELAAARRRGARWLRPAGAGAGVAVAAIAGSLLLAGPRQAGELPFPAEALRTAVPVADFALTDQDGACFDLAGERGRVVLLTAVYSTCGSTCPHILQGVRDAVAALDPRERAGLTVAAITLDPARDTPAQLALLAQARGLAAPQFRLLTGEPAGVEAILDRLGVARVRDPRTGVIEHANLFLLVDREHRLAYTLTLGERQQRWLVTALRLLLAEPAS